MALGGGTFLTQNKVLPGSYINVISANKASAELSDRGIVALPVTIGLWENGKVKTITKDEFQKNSMELFGYNYTDKELKPLREVFLNAQKAHLYKMNLSDVKASWTYGTAKVNGVNGNNLKLNISNTQIEVEDGEPIAAYNIETYLNDVLVHENIFNPNEPSTWVDNDYWSFKTDNVQSLPTGWQYFNGGNDGVIPESEYQVFLDVIEKYTFNIVACTSTDEIVKQLFAVWTKRMRDEVGAKFQTVIYKYSDADYEGVISVENDIISNDTVDIANLVYWVSGAQAACNVNKSLTNAKYTGEYEIDTSHTQTELEDALTKGKFIFHKVDEVVRVLDDINTFITFTDEKSKDFSSNQTMRVLDQSANDIANLFAKKYLGNIPNDESGRISLWNDILKLNQELEKLRAIEKFNPNSLIVQKGDSKKSVVVSNPIEPVNAMTQLYMTIIIM